MHSYCNSTHEKTVGKVAALVGQYLPELFQPSLICAGYESAEQGSCQGDSGGPLMVFNTKLAQYFQVGMVAGAVSSCGDKEIPGYYTRLDYPDIANFIQDPQNVLKQGIYADVVTLEANGKHVIAFLFMIIPKIQMRNEQTPADRWLVHVQPLLAIQKFVLLLK